MTFIKLVCCFYPIGAEDVRLGGGGVRCNLVIDFHNAEHSGKKKNIFAKHLSSLSDLLKV